MLPPLLTADQLAELLSVKVTTVHELVKAGKLPQPVRISSKIHRWPASQIAAALGLSS